ncbi:alginate export family protein [Rhizosaccharibacter radicis]|uniref:Alginate export family protein n=1 Tax=Rhizosaccharibacter radicis TaxID=2782605 RepID=A0ABT1VUD5_9PROT|nr:alginate export family protein [Acetobacteraceae bacterium KSS12]
MLAPTAGARAQTDSPDREEAYGGPLPATPAPDTSVGSWGVFNAQNGQAAGWGPVARYAQARWAEDWSWLRDRSAAGRHDWFDRLKFIRLDDRGSVYLTLSGEERLRTFHESRPFLGTQRPVDSDRLLVRSVLGADLHLGPDIRTYVELVNGIAGGRRYYGYNAGNQRSRLELQQGFLEISGTVLGARAGVIGGRQVFLDAPPYVLSLRDLPNLVQSWNGLRGYAVWDRFRLDTFYLLQTDWLPAAMLADDANWNARLFGAYGSWGLPGFRMAGRPGQLFADLFYYGYLYSGAMAAIGGPGGSLDGSTRRDNVGVRLWGAAGPVELSVGGIHQGGRFHPRGGGSRPVDAYSVNASVSYRFAGLRGRPAAGIQADLFSGGDARRRTGTVGTYAAPYFNVPFYNDVTTYLGPQNAVSAGPVAEWKPWKQVTLRAHLPLFWRASTNDDLYGTNRVYSFRDLHGGFVGALPQAGIAFQVTPHLAWSHDLAAFLASSSLHRAGGRDGGFYMQTLDFKF